MDNNMWRPATKEDVTRGTVCRGPGSEMHAFNDSVIVCVEEDRYGRIITLTRPMAFAHLAYNDKAPILTAETISLYEKSFLEQFQVLQFRDGVCTFAK